MERITTSSITEGLKIPFGRLREWIVKGYIKPSFPSPGQGQAAEFTLDDVYQISLFRHLIENGFSREVAGEFVGQLVKVEERVEYILFRVTINNSTGEARRDITALAPGENSLDLLSGTTEAMRKEAKKTRNRELPLADQVWETISIVNLGSLRKGVDKAFKR